VLCEKTLGKEHPDVAAALNNIGVVLTAQGQYAEALKHHRRAFAIAEKAVGPEHSLTRKLNNSLALCIAQQSGFVDDDKKRGANKPRGVVVLRCVPGCRGLKPGDWLTAYNNTPLESTEQLQELTGKTPPDQTVTLAIVRNGKKQTLPAHGGWLGAELY
jgi:tetratricopeptide (TPR) repeat protein